MSEGLKIDSSIYIWLVIIVFIIPVAITLISEFVFTKRITLKVGGLSVLIMTITTAILAYQLHGTKVTVADNKLVLSSLFYSSEVLLKDIDTVEIFKHELPPRYYLIQRVNGIHLPNYFAGKFKTHEKLDSFVLATYPPYLVITSNSKELYILSSSNQLEEALLKFDKSQ
ncbi:hypothetical protein [Vibrio sp. TRT 17S01]|uniref:hypothetical protein n=1 Tax=Vibrio sp. TRT 17S01 TaxID=3418505 RepID=UPI003CF38DE6